MSCEVALAAEGLATAIVVTHVVALPQMHGLRVSCEVALHAEGLATAIVTAHLVALPWMRWL